MHKKTLVLGASPNPSRYSYLAMNRLASMKHPVVGIGNKKGNVAGVEIATDQQPLENIHTVTLYLSAANQQPYYEYILGLNPKRIIFNPGAENEELASLAEEKGIEPIEACTLVMLATGQY